MIHLALGAAPALAAGRGTAKPGLIHLDLARQFRLIAPWALHRDPHLVQHQPGCLVGAAKLALQLLRTHTGLAARHEPDRPEPEEQRQARLLEDRPGQDRGLLVTGCAGIETAFRQPSISRPAAWAGEAVLPAKLCQVPSAVLVPLEPVEELDQRRGLASPGPRADLGSRRSSHQPSCYLRQRDTPPL